MKDHSIRKPSQPKLKRTPTQPAKDSEQLIRPPTSLHHVLLQQDR